MSWGSTPSSLTERGTFTSTFAVNIRISTHVIMCASNYFVIVSAGNERGADKLVSQEQAIPRLSNGSLVSGSALPWMFNSRTRKQCKTLPDAWTAQTLNQISTTLKILCCRHKLAQIWRLCRTEVVERRGKRVRTELMDIAFFRIVTRTLIILAPGFLIRKLIAARDWTGEETLLNLSAILHVNKRQNSRSAFIWISL